MHISFSKYEGAGNDFILIDNQEGKYKLSEKNILGLCDRRFGVGADGLMLLESDKETDFKMKYYNSDGKEGSMCGNGGRCIVAFANKIGIKKEHYQFMAIDGLHEAFLSKNTVELKMSDVENIRKFNSEWFLDTGSPHAVKVVNETIILTLIQKGRIYVSISDLEKMENGELDYQDV